MKIETRATILLPDSFIFERVDLPAGFRVEVEEALTRK